MTDHIVPAGSVRHPLRKPCACTSETGYIIETGGQQVVRCVRCHRGLYNAPKSETGLARRSVSDRPQIKPSKRARIIERDNGTCQKCHKTEGRMHIGHLLSVKDGRAIGATDEELWDDDNLVLECEECNLGFGERTPAPRLVYRVLQVRMKSRKPVDE